MVVVQEKARIPELFDEEDFIRMVEAINLHYPTKTYWQKYQKARDKCILSFLHFAGLRPKEAVNIRWEDIRLKNMSLFIRGENNKERKDKIAAITPEMFFYLFDLQNFGKLSKYLFISTKTREKPIVMSLWKYIHREKILKPSGLYISSTSSSKPRTRSYSHRASFAVRILKKCKEPQLVMQSLGHADWRSFKHYAYIKEVNDTNLDEIRKLSSYL